MTRSQVVHLQERVAVLLEKMKASNATLNVASITDVFNYQEMLAEIAALQERKEELLKSLAAIDAQLKRKYDVVNRKHVLDMRKLQRQSPPTTIL